MQRSRGRIEAVLVTFATGHKIAGRFDIISLTKDFLGLGVLKDHNVIFCTLAVYVDCGVLVGRVR